MLDSKSHETELESIINLSSAPLKDLSLIIDHIKEQIEIFQTIPTLARPFLKRDIPTLTQLKEKEWLDFLNRIKGNLETINLAASNIIKTQSSEHADIGEISSMESNQTTAEETEEDSEALTIDQIEPEFEKSVYCPECGQKCNGISGLKVHIYEAHIESIEEMLEIIKEYNL